MTPAPSLATCLQQILSCRAERNYMLVLSAEALTPAARQRYWRLAADWAAQARAWGERARMAEQIRAAEAS